MSRVNAAACQLVALALLVTACSGGSRAPTAAVTPEAERLVSPPATSVPTPPAARASISASGVISGQATNPRLLGGCRQSGVAYAAQFQLTFDGQPYVLIMEILDYHGPGEYAIPPERVSLRSAADNATQGLYPGISGRVTVDPGERSGKIDATLRSPRNTEVHGTWACT